MTTINIIAQVLVLVVTAVISVTAILLGTQKLRYSTDEYSGMFLFGGLALAVVAVVQFIVLLTNAAKV